MGDKKDNKHKLKQKQQQKQQQQKKKKQQQQQQQQKQQQRHRQDIRGRMWKPGEPAPPRISSTTAPRDLSSLHKLKKGDLEAAAQALLEKNRKLRGEGGTLAQQRRKRKSAGTEREPEPEPKPARSFAEAQSKSPATKTLSSSVRNLKFMARKATLVEQQELRRAEQKKLKEMHWVVEGLPKPRFQPGVVVAAANQDGATGSATGAVVIRCTVDERVGREESTERGACEEGEPCLARRSFGRFNPTVEQRTSTGGVNGSEEDDTVESAEDMVARYAHIGGGSVPVKRGPRHFGHSSGSVNKQQRKRRK